MDALTETRGEAEIVQFVCGVFLCGCHGEVADSHAPFRILQFAQDNIRVDVGRKDRRAEGVAEVCGFG